MYKSDITANVGRLRFVLFLTNSFQECTSVLLNEYVDIFPSTYFIKIYIHLIGYDDLGPSKTPLTLLKPNLSEDLEQMSDKWCKFYPTEGSFIGIRSESTVNLVISDLKPFYKSQLKSADSEKKSSVLSFVGGRIHTGKGEDEEGFCTVNGDRMYTLVLAEEGEQELILSNIERFWSKFHNNSLFPYYFLVFGRNVKGSQKVVCYFSFPKNKGVTKFPVLLCEKTYYNSVFEVMAGSKPRKPHLWATSLSTRILTNYRIDHAITWDTYLKKDVVEVLIRELMKRANETVFPAVYYNVDLVWASINVSSRQTRHVGVLVDHKTTKFVSCFAEPKLSFSMYISAFRKEVWICIGACCSFITILTSVYNEKLELSKSFSPFFFFVSTLVEEPYSVPTSLWNNRFFKTLTLAWLLAAIIFTNLYVGLMISDVTTPLRGNILSGFDIVLSTEKRYAEMSSLSKAEIGNYWRSPITNRRYRKESRGHLVLYGCETPFNYTNHDFHHKQLNSKESFTIMQIPLDSCGANDIGDAERMRFLAHPWMYSGFQRLESELLTSNRLDEDKRYEHRLVAYFSPRNRHYPKNPNLQLPTYGKLPFYSSVAIEKELIACERSVLMGDTKELIYELSYLMVNYPKKGFYLSEDTFETGWSSPVVWSFSNGGMSRVPMYFQLLMEAGIRNAIIGLRKNKYYLMRRTGSKYIRKGLAVIEGFGMEGSIQTIFIILMVSLSIASLVFMNEVLFKYWRKQKLAKIGTLSLQLRRNGLNTILSIVIPN
jgi:hypothetical protein